MKLLVSKKLFVSFLLFICMSGFLFSYSEGDYRSRQTGAWEEASTWEIYRNGHWFTAVEPPSQVSGYGNTVYINHFVWIPAEITIKYNLVIHQYSILHSNPYQETYSTINFYGHNIQLDGLLGDQSDKIITLKILSDASNIVKIQGEGYLKIKNLYCKNYIFLDVFSRLEAIFVNSNYTHLWIKNIVQANSFNLFSKNSIVELWGTLKILKFLKIGGGSNFNQAPEFKIMTNGNLLLPDNYYQEYEALMLGYQNTYAKFTIKGISTQKARISTIDENSYWNINYPSSTNNGHKIQLTVKNAIFENVESEGLEIRNGVKIQDNIFENCEFLLTRPSRTTTLLNIKGPRYLDIKNPVFESSYVGYYHHNIKYTSSRGQINVYNATGNISGENYDEDPYNNVHWYYSKSGEKNINIVSSITNVKNYPNPFNPKTTISFNISKNSKVNLSIYNLKGKLVKTLINKKLSPNQYQIVWEGKDNFGKKVSSGEYFYKLKVDNFIITKKLILLK